MGKQRQVVQRARGHHTAQAANGGASIVNTTNINLATLEPDRRRALNQLPPPVPDFVGRTAELDLIVEALSTAAAHGGTVLICGMGGVGKTQLAYAVAQRLIGSFPDAQIRLDLHGAEQRPLAPEQALQRAVQALEPQAQPADDLASVEAMYRALLAGKRALIVADDAGSSAQVRALAVPPGSALLITSRNHFVLPRITVVELGMLSESEAAALVRDICPRIAEAAPQLAQLCGRLPLALRVSGSLLAADTTRNVAAYIESLREVRARLAELHDPDDPQLDVEASLNLSYAALSAEEQAALRQLSIFPANFDLPAAKEVVLLDAASARQKDQQRMATLSAEALAAFQQFGIFAPNVERATFAKVELVNGAATKPNSQLAAQNDPSPSLRSRGRAVPPSLEQVMSALYRRSLLIYNPATERYILHDLVRDFAATRLTSGEIGRLDRYARHYLHVTQLSSALYTIGGDQMKALALFDRERVRVDAGWNWAHSQSNHALLVDYAVALTVIGELRYHSRRDLLPRTEAALHAARQLHRHHEETVFLNALGIVYRNLGQVRQAINYHEQSLKLVLIKRDRFGEGNALLNLGNAHIVLGYTQRAIKFLEQALKSSRELGDRRNEGNALGNLGLAYLDLGDTRRAIEFQEQSLSISRDLGIRRSEGIDIGNLGRAYLDFGDSERAIELGNQSLTLLQEIGARYYEAYALNYLALACAAAGQQERAQSLHAQALALSQAVEAHRLEAQILIDVGKSQLGQGDAPAAIEYFTQALSIAQEQGYQIEAARASWNLGLAYAQNGESARAIPFLQARVDYERAIGHARAEEHAAYLAQVKAQSGTQ